MHRPAESGGRSTCSRGVARRRCARASPLLLLLLRLVVECLSKLCLIEWRQCHAKNERTMYAHLEVREVHCFLANVVGGERGDEVVDGDAHCFRRKKEVVAVLFVVGAGGANRQEGAIGGGTESTLYERAAAIYRTADCRAGTSIRTPSSARQLRQPLVIHPSTGSSSRWRDHRLLDLCKLLQNDDDEHDNVGGPPKMRTSIMMS